MKFKLPQLTKNKLSKFRYKYNKRGIILLNKCSRIYFQTKDVRELEKEKKVLTEILEEYFLLYS